MSNTEKLIDKKSFIFHDFHNFYHPLNDGKTQKPYCKVNIEVILTTYEDKREFYYINYEWFYLHWLKEKYGSTLIKHNDLLMNRKKYNEENSLQLDSLNPFCKDREYFEDHINGEIIVKNELSNILIKYLLMDFEELSKHSGSVTPQNYKLSIMKSISLLWD